MLYASDQLLAQASSDGSILPMLLMMAAIFALLYFVMIRPQKKRQKKQQEMQSTVANGTRLVTIGGLYGTVVDSDDETITLEASDDTYLVFARQAIGRVLTDESAAADDSAVADPADSDVSEPTLSDDDLDKLRSSDDGDPGKDKGKKY